MAKSDSVVSNAVEIVKEAWDVLSSKFNQLWLLALIAFIPSLVSSLFTNEEKLDGNQLKVSLEAGNFDGARDYLETAFGVSLEQLSLIALILFVLSFVWTVFAQGANISNAISVMKNKKTDVSVDTIISGGTSHFGRLAVAFIVVGLIVGAGLLLLFIPGIIAAFLLGFTFYFIVDKDMGLADAMRSSYELAKNNVANILGLIFVLFIVGIGIAILTAIVTGILPSSRLDDIAAAAINAVFGVLGLLAAARLYLNLTKKHRTAKTARVVSE